MIKIETFLRMNLACIRLDLFGMLEGNPRQLTALIGMVRTSPVQIEVSFAHQAVGSNELRVAPNRFLQQTDALKQVSFCIRIIRQVIQFPRPQIQVVRHGISRRWFRNPCFFVVR